jgi:hypothetical protein
MKIPRNLSKKILPLLLLGFISLPTLQAQSSKQDKAARERAQIKNMVDSQNYVFKAQTALPMSGRMRQLTSDYDLKVSRKSLESYLPYFGRAYTAPIDPSEGGIKFISKDFDYKASEKKKGGWDILIKPRDTRDIQLLVFNISENGNAVLQVNLNNKQPITFNGYITAPPSAKTK